MSVSRRAWREAEDQSLMQLIERLGRRNWGAVAHALHHEFGYRERSGKQCRERWHNQLNPRIDKGRWTESEQNFVFEMHSKFGNKWTTMSQQLPGRTDNAIKNFFYSTIRRSLRRISKLLGQKNSTLFVRDIKPITLSRIFASQSELFEKGVETCSIKNENLKKEDIKTIFNFLKTEILAFTRISFGKSEKQQKQKLEFHKQKMDRVLKQIVVIKLFEENDEEQELRQGSSEVEFKSDDQSVKSEEESLHYIGVKKEDNPQAKIEEPNQMEHLAVIDRIKQGNKLPFYPGLEFQDINVNFNPVNPYPYHHGMDYYYYSPMLYFQPKINSSQSYNIEVQKTHNENNVTEKNMEQIQRQNDKNTIKIERVSSSFSEGRLPSVKELLQGLNSGWKDKNISLTADQYQKIVFDLMDTLDRRLTEWRLN